MIGLTSHYVLSRLNSKTKDPVIMEVIRFQTHILLPPIRDTTKSEKHPGPSIELETPEQPVMKMAVNLTPLLISVALCFPRRLFTIPAAGSPHVQDFGSRPFCCRDPRIGG